MGAPAEVVANQEHRRLIPGFGGRISAALVWDGGEDVWIPEAMGKPREDQMQGTSRERLVELAGRVCYDSLGKGRSSADYARHLIEVGHLSVLEHAAFTVQIEENVRDYTDALLNKPCLYVRPVGYVSSTGWDKEAFRMTLNLRHALEWKGSFRNIPQRLASLVAPDLVKCVEGFLPDTFGGADPGHLVEPEIDEEKWVTLYLVGSRGWSHELVRHGDWTAISQRSTRYVDESESQWVLHPLVAAYVQSMPGPLEMGHFISTWAQATGAYDDAVRDLQSFLLAKGIDKVSARKQARGAARGLLGNALETEVIFSASVAQWRHMLSMRAADAADAEIRLQFAEAVLPCLRASRYGDRFGDFELVPASDGIGRSLKGGGHR